MVISHSKWWFRTGLRQHLLEALDFSVERRVRGGVVHFAVCLRVDEAMG